MTHLGIPGTPARICVEDKVVSTRSKNRPTWRPVHPDKMGVIVLRIAGGKTLHSTADALLESARTGTPPKDIRGEVVKTVERVAWSAMTRPMETSHGVSITYHMHVLPHHPVTSLRSGLEHQGITWRDPIMLGIDAWMEAA